MITPVLTIAIATTIITKIVIGLFEEGFLRLIIVFVTVFIVGCILTMAIALNKEQRRKVAIILKEKIKK